MRVLAPLSAALLIWGSLTGCSADNAPASEPTSVAVPNPAEAPALVVKDADKSLTFRYFPKSGSPKIASSRDDVPLESREAVLVIPDGIEVPAGLAYVADLRTAATDGSYPVKVVTQAELDTTLAATRVALAPKGQGTVALGGSPGSGTGGSAATTSAQGQATSGKNEVIMFSTSWCGVCSQARRWFKNKGIDVVERDIEEDPSAQQDMVRRAGIAGLDGSRLTGVPVIWVNGQMFPGFDPGKIQQALRS